MEAIHVPKYDFNKHQRSAETRRVEPADVVLLEGILVLSMKSIRRFLNMKIFVDTDDDVRLARRWSFFTSMREFPASVGHDSRSKCTEVDAESTCYGSDKHRFLEQVLADRGADLSRSHFHSLLLQDTAGCLDEGA